jgi:hypothetical protein
MAEQATYAEWLEWFYCNADFGPAHGDVMLGMYEDFEYETGKSIPSEIGEEYE